LSTVGRWVLRLVILSLILASLYYVNNYTQLGNMVHTLLPLPGALHILGDFYLPIMFLLILGIAWLGVLIWRLLTAEETSEFPDLDQAWQEALEALEQARVDLTEEPVFLVLGQTAGTDTVLFPAAFAHTQRPLLVNGAPSRKEAPLRVYVGETLPVPPSRVPQRGIFITCPGASVLGEFVQFLSREPEPAGMALPEGVEGEGGAGGHVNLFATMRPGAMPQGIQDIVRAVTQEKRELSESEKKELRRLMGQDDADLARQVRQARAPFSEERREEIQRQQQRLGYLCRLIALARQPWCPVNGMLVLVPWAGADAQQDAEQTAAACRLDLQTVRAALGVNCPVLALVADLEQATGAQEFIQRISPKNRTRRVGRSFELAPAVTGPGLPEMVNGGVQWFCTAMLPRWIYELFDLESSAKPDRTVVTDGNVELHQVLTQVLERQERLSWILTQGFLDAGGEPPLFGGCYMAGTGANSANEQAFIAGVIYRLLEEQDNVSWTQQALADDAWYQRWSVLAWVMVLLLLLALGGLLLLFLRTGGDWRVALGLGALLALMAVIPLLRR
jgi:hypothetical protein